MPRNNILQLDCDWCGAKDNIHLGDPTVAQKLRKWLGVMSGDCPPTQDGSDVHRWYDTPECMARGEARFEKMRSEIEAKQAEDDRIRAGLEQKMKKAQEQIKESAYCKQEGPKLVTP
jgi:hypothetical protein